MIRKLFRRYNMSKSLSRTFGSLDAAADAVEYATMLYDGQVELIRNGFSDYVLNSDMPERGQRWRGYYPSISVQATDIIPPRTTSAYGFLSHRGDATYTGTFCAPEEMGGYFRTQLQHIKDNHGDDVVLRVDLSDVPIPLDYSGAVDNTDLYRKITSDKEDATGLYFDLPDDRYMPGPEIKDEDPDNQQYPLTWYSAPQMDKSLRRISYYTGTDPKFFQDYILFTNYPTYMDLFEDFTKGKFDANEDNPVIALVTPGNKVVWNPSVENQNFNFGGYKTKDLPRGPQMPAYHMVRRDGSGVSIVNIGVGAPNAANMTDHLAVLRPEAWMMVGHCAGLQATQRLGDFVVPNGYVLEDGLMEKKINGHNDVCDIAEVQSALMNSIRTISGSGGQNYKERARTGIVKTVADRNWEDPLTLADRKLLREQFARNNAIGLDMESGTIAAQGFWHRVPHGAILCVSDMPLQGIIKRSGGPLEGFYRKRVSEHFQIAMAATEELRQMPKDELHSRKLRSSHASVPFL